MNWEEYMHPNKRMIKTIKRNKCRTDRFSPVVLRLSEKKSKTITYQKVKGEIGHKNESSAMVYTKKFLERYGLEHIAEYIQI